MRSSRWVKPERRVIQVPIHEGRRFSDHHAIKQVVAKTNQKLVIELLLKLLNFQLVFKVQTLMEEAHVTEDAVNQIIKAYKDGFELSDEQRRVLATFVATYGD